MQAQSVTDPARPMRMAAVPDGKGGTVHKLVPATVEPVRKGKRKRIVPDPIKANPDAAAQQLRLLIERIEGIDGEILGLLDDRNDVYQEAKATGYSKKAMRDIIARRKKDPNALQEEQAILDTYLTALGME
ncbi:uncharacterized protein (UPF0335 family) [Sphingobium vermicomposti]|uniref:Uncharacterized protein (UPF0335 family) n=1 Tax=Sphingobium vermicomposti TaxID=529005 RepID=A0A846MCX5_9SPHN|nr:uncharacterized protein (UPF0335 family) [Sphingobium vermicomposti]